MRQSAWWLRFQMLYFFKTFGFPSGEFLYFLPFSAHSASCQLFFSQERAPTEREARSIWLCTAPLPPQHRRKTAAKIFPLPQQFFFLKKNHWGLKQGIFWGRGASAGHPSGCVYSCTVYYMGRGELLGTA